MKNHKRLMGIDPGKHGAIAWEDDTGSPVVVSMPGSMIELNTAIITAYESGVGMAIIEDQHSRPGQSAQSTWTFARHVGVLEATLWHRQMPFRRVPPQQWMKTLGVKGKKKDPKATYQLVLERYPDLKIKADQADAVCLLIYARILAERELL